MLITSQMPDDTMIIHSFNKNGVRIETNEVDVMPSQNSLQQMANTLKINIVAITISHIFIINYEESNYEECNDSIHNMLTKKGYITKPKGDDN